MLITGNISNVSQVFVGETVKVSYSYVTVTTLILVQRMKNYEVQLCLYIGNVKPTKVQFRAPGSDFIQGNENSPR